MRRPPVCLSRRASKGMDTQLLLNLNDGQTVRNIEGNNFTLLINGSIFMTPLHAAQFTSPRKIDKMIHQQFRVIDLLTWTTLIAALFATYMLDTQYPRYFMIVAVPFAFIVSLIRQPITLPRMWTSLLFTVLLSSWLGWLSVVILAATFSRPGLSFIYLLGISLIVSFFASVFVPCLIGSLREKPRDPGAGT